MGRLSSDQATAAGDRTCRRIQSESEPLEVSQASQLSASLERFINNTWENTGQVQGSEDLQEMMNNDNQEVEVEETALFKTGNLLK